MQSTGVCTGDRLTILPCISMGSGGAAIALTTAVGCCSDCKGCVEHGCWKGGNGSCCSRDGMEASTLDGFIGADAVSGTKRWGAVNGCGTRAAPTDAAASVDVEAGHFAVGAATAGVAVGRVCGVTPVRAPIAGVAFGRFCDATPVLDATVRRPRAGAEAEDDDEEDDEELEDEDEEEEEEVALAAPLVI